MNGRTWIPLTIGTALVAAVAAYAITNARQASVDAPRDEPAAQTAAEAWLGSDVAVPAGTELAVRLQTTLSTKTSREGDAFLATVGGPIVVNGKVAIPQGASVHGHVALSQQPGKASGRGRMQLVFDEVTYEGRSYALDTQSPVFESKSGKGKDAALVGGGASGTAASLLTRGPQLELMAGSVLRVHLDKDVSVRPAKEAA